MRFAPVGLCLLLAACGADPVRLAVPPAASTAQVGIAFATLEVLAVSLPAYAEGEEIVVRSGGALVPTGGAIWADDPPRALTLDLSRALSEITGARVAPEPWPFEERAEARLDVRVAEIVADEGGSFVMRGQYFAASQDGSGRDRARGFRIEVPFDPTLGPGAIAVARGQATVALAQEIASSGLR